MAERLISKKENEELINSLPCLKAGIPQTSIILTWGGEEAILATGGDRSMKRACAGIIVLSLLLLPAATLADVMVGLEGETTLREGAIEILPQFLLGVETDSSLILASAWARNTLEPPGFTLEASLTYALNVAIYKNAEIYVGPAFGGVLIGTQVEEAYEFTISSTWALRAFSIINYENIWAGAGLEFSLTGIQLGIGVGIRFADEAVF
ncbi:MAG: hypothetical protein ABC596_05845 [Candidatus Methanosuratincola petrocarbonis]